MNHTEHIYLCFQVPWQWFPEQDLQHQQAGDKVFSKSSPKLGIARVTRRQMMGTVARSSSCPRNYSMYSCGNGSGITPPFPVNVFGWLCV